MSLRFATLPALRHLPIRSMRRNLPPEWFDHADLPPSLPAALRRWLLLDSSMTSELRRHCRTDISVRLFHQGGGCLLGEEAGLVAARTAAVQVREVALKAGGQAVMAARSVHASARVQTRLALLGTRPLADLLFADGAPRRECRQFALLRPEAAQSALARRITGVAKTAGDDLPGCYWARRTLYRVDGQRLLLTEIFLPALLATLVSDSTYPPNGGSS